MRSAVLLAVVGCGTGPAATSAAHSPAPPIISEAGGLDWAVSPPRRDRSEHIPIEQHGGPEVVLGIDVAPRTANEFTQTDLLSPCVREFVLARDEAARGPLIAALTQYVTSCDGGGRVVLERPLGYERRERRSRSDVMFVGTLSSRRLEVSLRVVSCGRASASPDHITIAVDDSTWTSPRLEFRRDADTTCDAAELPYTRSLGRALQQVIDGGDAMIRFEGASPDGDLAIGDAMKRELRVVLDALDALD